MSKRIIQDDSLLKERRTSKKRTNLIKNQQERFAFKDSLNEDFSGKEYSVTFDYKWSLIMKRGKPELVKYCWIILNKYIPREKFEKVVRNAIESI